MPRKTTTRRRDLPDGRTLVTRRMLAYLSGRTDETVRKRCEPIACDVANRTPLYDLETSSDTLASLRVGGA